MSPEREGHLAFGVVLGRTMNQAFITPTREKYQQYHCNQILAAFFWPESGLRDSKVSIT